MPVLLAAALLVSALAACSRSSAASGAHAPYVLGATVDLSGPLAAYGRGFSAAWHGYFDAVDGRGGVDGHRIVLDILDDAGDPARQAANFRTLVARHALLVSGITVSDTCALLAASATAARVPELCTTIPATLALAPPPGVFSMSDPETMWVKAIARIVQQQVPARSVRVATILPTVAGLHDMGVAFEAEAAARGWTVATTQTVPLGHLSDVGAQVAAVLAARPDAVLTDIAAVGAVPMVQALRAGGFAGPVVMGDSDYSTMAVLHDPKLFQVWPTDVVDPGSTRPAVRNMVSDLAAQGVTDVSAVNSLAMPLEYLGAALVDRAIGACSDPCSPSLLAGAMATASVNLPGLSVGRYGYASGRNVPNTAIDIFAWDPASGAPRRWAANLPAVQPFAATS